MGSAHLYVRVGAMDAHVGGRVLRAGIIRRGKHVHALRMLEEVAKWQDAA